MSRITENLLGEAFVQNVEVKSYGNKCINVGEGAHSNTVNCHSKCRNGVYSDAKFSNLPILDTCII